MTNWNVCKNAKFVVLDNQACLIIRVMRGLKFLFLLVIAIFCFSCEDPLPDPVIPEDPDKTETPVKPEEPEELPELTPNTYRLKEELYKFGSVAVSNVGEYLCIAATPKEGVESFDAIFEQEEFFYVAISPLLNGKLFDMMLEDNLYTVMSTLDGMPLETVAPGMTEEIVSGKCIFDYENGCAAADLNIRLADGTYFEAMLFAEEPDLVVNENIFALNGVEKPVRTAFHLLEEGTTALYLTPAGISFFDELDIVTYYAYIILDNDKCHGKTLSVNDIVAVGYVDNFNEIIVDSRNVVTTGTLNILKDPENSDHYMVSADLCFDGVTLHLRFDGNTIDANAKEVVKNEVIYEGTSYGITEVWLNKTPSPDQNTWTVMVVTETEESVNITMPVSFLDGNAHGFSQSKDLYIEYNGVTYSKAEGYSGTVTVGVEGDIIKINVTNYDNLEVIYEGTFEEVS